MHVAASSDLRKLMTATVHIDSAVRSASPNDNVIPEPPGAVGFKEWIEGAHFAAALVLRPERRATKNDGLPHVRVGAEWV
jgi:hypothetical protein